MTTELCEPQRFEMYQGDTKVLNFEVTDENDEDVDITDAQGAIFGLYDPNDDNAEVLRLETPSDITFATNVVTVTIPSSTDLEVQEYIFELQLTDVDGGIETLAQGRANVKRSYIV